MKAKKWLTIITLIVSFVSLFAALIIGKASNCIGYDIAMALLGSAVLGFIMSITEYYVERRKAMENFWQEANAVLKQLRKIKYLEEDAPIDLIINAFGEERSNEWGKLFATLSDNTEDDHAAKDNLISWYEEHIPMPFDENTDVEKELESFYTSRMDGYKSDFLKCMDSYREASSVDLGNLDNAYGNLDFICGNRSIRKDAYNDIFNKLRAIVFQFRSEVYHFNLLRDGKGNFPVCATKVNELNNKYFFAKEGASHGMTNTLIYQKMFDDVDAALEKFRCKIYRTKYVESKPEPISGKMIYFGEDKKE